MKTSSLILACVAANAARADDSTACLAKFTQVLQAGIVSTDIQQCVKDTGVSPTSPNLTEADLQKALAAPSCLKCQGNQTPWDLPNTDGKSTFNTASFNWTLTDLFNFAKATGANGATAEAPTATTGVTAAPASNSTASTTSLPSTAVPTTTTKSAGVHAIFSAAVLVAAMFFA
ncbi:unnamed protein product [Aphanomyces euteiches]